MKSLSSIVPVVIAIAVFGCAPAEPPPEIEEAEMLNGLANGSFTAQLNGFDIHYEVHGEGPVLMVLTNSWGFSADGVRALFSPLEERLTMVYMDPRGMGESGPIVEESDMGTAAVRADFQALREHLGLVAVNAMGWSNGAMNLILLASEAPETIDNAIFVHGVASYTQDDYAAMAADYPELMQKYAQFLEDVQNPELTDAERTEMQTKLWLEDYFPVSTGDPENAPAMIDRLFGDVAFNYRYAEYANKEFPVFDARDQLPKITARCMVVAGAHDMIKPDAVQKLHEGLANSEFIVFESSGHFAPAEEPEAFKEAVFAFLGVG
jgi:proline iminopeptidase